MDDKRVWERKVEKMDKENNGLIDRLYSRISELEAENKRLREKLREVMGLEKQLTGGQ